MKILIALLFFLFSAGVLHAEEKQDLIFKSLDGKTEHHFLATGDYLGTHRFEKATKEYKGVYRMGEGVCWSTRQDGTKGNEGNVLIYYDDIQCCLALNPIADKVAVTYIWSKPHYISFGICSNNVLKRQ